jgi:hypothetical protein
MKVTDASCATELRRLHKEIWDSVRATLDKAIRVEKLLREQRARMDEDEWHSWLTENCPFAEQSERDRLREVLFAFTQDMGRTLIGIEGKLDQLHIERTVKVSRH